MHRFDAHCLSLSSSFFLFSQTTLLKHCRLLVAAAAAALAQQGSKRFRNRWQRSSADFICCTDTADALTLQLASQLKRALNKR
jgi:hypothetical protein